MNYAVLLLFVISGHLLATSYHVTTGPETTRPPVPATKFEDKVGGGVFAGNICPDFPPLVSNIARNVQAILEKHDCASCHGPGKVNSHLVTDVELLTAMRDVTEGFKNMPKSNPALRLSADEIVILQTWAKKLLE